MAEMVKSDSTSKSISWPAMNLIVTIMMLRLGDRRLANTVFKYVLIFNQVCETQMFSSLIRDYELLSSSAHIPVGVIKNNPLVGLFVDCVNES